LGDPGIVLRTGRCHRKAGGGHVVVAVLLPPDVTWLAEELITSDTVARFTIALSRRESSTRPRPCA
jgi:hypothetical protein